MKAICCWVRSSTFPAPLYWRYPGGEESWWSSVFGSEVDLFGERGGDAGNLLHAGGEGVICERFVVVGHHSVHQGHDLHQFRRPPMFLQHPHQRLDEPRPIDIVPPREMTCKYKYSLLARLYTIELFLSSTIYGRSSCRDFTIYSCNIDLLGLTNCLCYSWKIK